MKVKKNLIKYKDPTTGKYVSIPAIAGEEDDLSSESIVTALGYTPANQEDVGRLSGEIDDLKENGTGGGATAEQIEQISEAMIIVNPLFNKTEQLGYMNESGNYENAGTFHSITTQKIPCNASDVFYYSGRGSSAAYSWIFYIDDTIHSAGQYMGETSVKIPDGVNYVRFSSYENINNEVPFNVSKETTSVVNDMYEFATGFGDMESQLVIYNAVEKNGYCQGNGTANGSSSHHCMITDKIPCKEGDMFIYKGVGSYSAYSWVFFNSNQVVSRGQYEGETIVTIPTGVNYVVFSSYAPINSDIIFEVTKKNSPSTKKLFELIDRINQSNVLYGKKYVACGDSFTEGDFSGWTDADGNTGKSSSYIYDKEMKMYKTYPYWIAKRNNMALINEAKCGSTMALSKNYISGTEEVTVRKPFSYQRYKDIPSDADYITLWFGLNDINNSNLGAIDDTTNETFYGAWNVVLEYLITNHPYAKIGIIITDAYDSFNDAVRNIGEKWGIPTLDLMGDKNVPLMMGRKDGINLDSRADTLRRNAFRVSETNFHPNLEAHMYQSTFIENFLRTL